MGIRNKLNTDTSSSKLKSHVKGTKFQAIEHCQVNTAFQLLVIPKESLGLIETMLDDVRGIRSGLLRRRLNTELMCVVVSSL